MAQSNELVRKGYNRIATSYLKTRSQFHTIAYVEKLDKLLKKGSRILDIGCGAGKPNDEYLAKIGHKVIGIDISAEQIKLAKNNVPQAYFEVKDMLVLRNGEYKVDAVISFYAIFHIPRELHMGLFQKINSFLPSGGFLLVTMGSSEWEGVEELHGAPMYWSHYGANKNRELIESAGFKILKDVIDTSGGEKHQVILAKKV